MLERSAKIMGNFSYAIRSHSCATMNQHLCCSKEGKRNTKEDKGKSSRWQKGTSQDEAMSNGEKTSP